MLYTDDNTPNSARTSFSSFESLAHSNAKSSSMYSLTTFPRREKENTQWNLSKEFPQLMESMSVYGADIEADRVR